MAELIDSTPAPQNSFLQQQSILGIISLGIALITSIAYCVIFVGAAGLIFSSVSDMSQLDALAADPSNMETSVFMGAMVLGLFMLAAPVLAIVGLGLGIGGFF